MAGKPMTVSSAEPEKVTVKKFKNEDLIPCRSITNGELLMIGPKTGNLYKWANYDEITDVEYSDLLYDVRSSDARFAMYPRFIVLDDDFIAQNKKLSDLYAKVYSVDDLRSVLIKTTPSEMKKIIIELPTGIQQTIKGLASTMIQEGSLDSVKKIKVIDDLFGTQLLLTLAEN